MSLPLSRYGKTRLRLGILAIHAAAIFLAPFNIDITISPV